MKSKVFFTGLRTKPGVSLLDKLEKLMARAGIGELDCRDRFTAVKIHFGEPGNLAYIRPNYVRRVVEVLERMGAKVFLTDANTLYSGQRANAVDHIRSAHENGFNSIVVKAPVVIADGLKGTDYKELPVEGGELCSVAKIGSAVADADVIVSVTHFKGHEMTGFGGTLKNLGMGAASVGGKLFLHSDSQPKVVAELCTGCGTCVKNCAHGAIHLDAGRKAAIDYTRCVGCGQCIAVCQFGAAQVVHNSTSEVINRKIAEYTKAILAGKANFHVSFIMNVSPECDCWGSNDMAIVPDIGIAASHDPVALDMACADLVTRAPALAGSVVMDAGVHRQVSHNHEHEREHENGSGRSLEHDHEYRHDHDHDHMIGEDKFKHTHPDTDWKSGLIHAQKIGLGSMDYELVEV